MPDPGTSGLLAWPDAVQAGWPDEGVAAHYGDPLREQRATEESAGVVDRSNRGVVRITGPDRLSWLHSLTTQALDGLAPGGSAQALILSPNGHVEHHLTLTDDGTATWLHVEPGTAAALVEFLESMRFMLRVEVADVSQDHAVLTVLGPGASDIAAGLEGVRASVNPGPFGTIDLIVARDRLAGAAGDLVRRGAAVAGMWAFEALRIAAHVPRLGLDTDHRTIPHEVGWIDAAVRLDKGCYRGQETVARVHNLGHPPRRLVFLSLDGSEDRLPGHGDPVALASDEQRATIGFTGSAARHYELGPIGLALVKRTVPVEATLLAGGVPAAQEVIVPPDAGANVKVTLRRRQLM
ncbi:MAG TPA: folate-binding protein [Streptosporangiaceae bacterium]|nr:folate-binding protein [Streptosporangiaceae bacterium]